MTKHLKTIVLSLFVALPLGGCQIVDDASNSWKQLNQIVDYARSAGSDISIDRGTVMSIPFATMGFRYGNSPQAVMSLAQSQGGRLFWVSSDGLSIVTENGRIVTTSGFPSDLTGGKTTTRDPLTLPHAKGWADYSLFRILDYKQDFGFSHTMECKLTDIGTEEITILGSTFTAQKFSEKCEVPTLKWSFENTHWLDTETGFPWRTRQWVSPSHKKPIVLEVLRPAQEDPGWQIHSSLKSTY